MTHVLVIGCASFDTLHLAGGVISTIGGAGLYTALAARRAGETVTLHAPRPRPLPEQLEPVAARLRWLGPQISPENMPRLEIAHHGGGRATLLNASWGAEARLLPDNLPDDLSIYTLIHVAALSSARRQMEFLQACRGRSSGRISVGTYARLVYGETEAVRQLFAQADLFFMNENEANGLFGSMNSARTSSGKLLFVTKGEHGALVYEGEHATHIPGVKADELDPTGAGDTFCGATLAGLLRGDSPAAAAGRAVELAARCVEAPGPAALL